MSTGNLGSLKFIDSKFSMNWMMLMLPDKKKREGHLQCRQKLFFFSDAYPKIYMGTGGETCTIGSIYVL